jgi:hypothetical protein
MVEGEDGVEEPELQVGNAGQCAGRARRPVQRGAHVVADEAGRERRARFAWQFRMFGELGGQDGERVARGPAMIQADGPVLSAQRGERIDAENAGAAALAARALAVEKHRAGILCETGEGVGGIDPADGLGLRRA